MDMTGLLLVVATLATTNVKDLPSYAEAYRQHKEDGRPLVVMVGADWCPACRTMKNTQIPDALREGALKDVVFTIVDVDANHQLANRIMRGDSVPQLVMYYDTAAGPRRVQINGVQDVDSIGEFVAAGVQTHHEQLESAQAPAIRAAGGS
jgi:thioredoxin-like negative regulator of GroEL